MTNPSQSAPSDPLFLLWQDGPHPHLLGVFSSLRAAHAARAGDWRADDSGWSRPASRRHPSARQFRVELRRLADATTFRSGDTLHLLWGAGRRSERLLGIFACIEEAQAAQPGQWFERDGAPGWTNQTLLGARAPQFTLDPVILDGRVI